MPQANQPFGSVGLTAVYYALKFRKNENVPVYICGLDFSYSIGKTHTKGALAHILKLISSSRLNGIANIAAAFGPGAQKFSDKQGKQFITTPTLKNYAAMFNSLFANEINLFDAGESGIPLSIPRATPQSFERKAFSLYATSFTDSQKQELLDYLQNEKESLEYLRNLLTGKTELTGEKLSEEIKKIAEPREYLYLHFADGWQFSANQSFLNRIRTEIDFFLKFL